MNPAADTNQFGNYSDWAKQNMANGIDANTLQSTLQKAGINPTQTQQTPTQSPQSGDFWSTVGSMALPTLGALLAPETGGLSLLGGIAGGAALSGVGGAAGKAIDNAAAGQNPLQANDLGSGALDALGAGVGGGLIKGVGALAKGVVAPLADKVGSSLVAGQSGELDGETAKYLYNNGVTNLKQVGDIFPLVSGDSGAYSNAVNNSFLNAAENGTRIDLSSLASNGKNLPSDAVLKSVRDAGISGDSNSVKSVQDYVQGQLEKYNQDALTSVPATKGGGQITGFDNGVLNAQKPLDAFNMTQDMDKTASKWLDSTSPNIQAQGQALRNLSNTLKDGLYGEGTSIGDTGITDQVRQQAIEDLAPLKDINPQYYQHKVDLLMGTDTTEPIKTIGQLRTAQKPDVLAKQALDFASNSANKNAGTDIPGLLKTGLPLGGFAVGGPLGAVGGLAASHAIGSNAANVAGASTLSKLSDVIGNKTAGKVMDILGKVGGAGAVNLPQAGASPTGQSTLGALGANNSGDNSMNPAGQSQNSINNILQMMEAHPYVYGGQMGGVLSSLAPQLQQNELLKNAIAGLSPELANAGGAQGTANGMPSVGGIGSMLSSLVPGTNANAYQGDVNSLAGLLSKTLGVDQQTAQNMIPGLLQNAQTAGQRQNVLGSISSGLAT